MKMSSYKRDAQGIKANLKVRQDTSVVTSKACSIVFPDKWIGTPLANISTGENVVLVVGFFALFMDKKYMVFNAPSLFPIVATKILKTELDGVEVRSIECEAGAVLFTSLKLVRDNNIPYYLDDNIIQKGGVLPYQSKDDRLSLLQNAKSMTGLGGLPDSAYISLRANHLMRDPNNYTKLTNNSVSGEYVPISISDVANSVPNAVGKFNGSYMDDGLQSILLDEATAGNSNVDNVLLAGNKA